MRIMITTLGVFLAIAAVGFIGFSANLSKNHHVEAEAVYDRPVTMVWQVLTDYATMPTWSATVAKTASLGIKDGKPAWHIELKDGHFMDISIDESIPNKHFKTTILDTDTPYEGSWIIDLEALSENKTVAKLSEDGKIKSPIWRFIMHYFIGQDTLIKTTLAQAGEELARRPLPTLQPTQPNALSTTPAESHLTH